jgi:hypothetical protein
MGHTSGYQYWYWVRGLMITPDFLDCPICLKPRVIPLMHSTTSFKTHCLRKLVDAKIKATQGQQGRGIHVPMHSIKTSVLIMAIQLPPILSKEPPSAEWSC